MIGYAAPPAPTIEEKEIYFRGDHSPSSEGKESEEQKKAVRTALSSNISYIWGAPGTGKTQYVLADCLLTYIKRGDRVVVLAPTHNALEQTLTAVIKTMQSQNEDINCIYRLGIPTAGFAAKYPNLCERVDQASTLELLEKEIENINSRIFEQQEAGRILKRYAQFKQLYISISDEEAKQAKLRKEISELQQILQTQNNSLSKITEDIQDAENSLRIIRLRENSVGFKFKSLFTQSEALSLENRKERISLELINSKEELRTAQKSIQTTKLEIAALDRRQDALLITINENTSQAKALFAQTFGNFFYNTLAEAETHFHAAAEEAKCKPRDPHLQEELKQKEEEYRAKAKSNEETLKSKQVFAFTLDYFFAHFKYLTPSEIGPLSHVFLDEAAYCPLIKSGILYSLGVPVTLLGDHMQLLPICEAGAAATERIESYLFLWEQSAIYFPEIFDSGTSLETMFKRFYAVKHAENITQVKYYSQENMETASLPQTHRFGNHLAKILDSFVYQNGFHGNDIHATKIHILHGKHLPQENGCRTSQGEVEAIKQYLHQYTPNSCAVLTPYKKQRDLLQKHLSGLIRPDNILTVHASQGREWDTVILSVVDCTNHDIYFTDSTKPYGLHTINTAISRVKSNLVIACDTTYWKKTGSTQLLGALVVSHEDVPSSTPPQMVHPNILRINWSPAMIEFYNLGISKGRLKTAIEQRKKIEARFASNILINKTTAPYASVKIASETNADTYATTLSSCTCKNFIHSHIPCKHIMTLALKLNLISEDGSRNNSLSIPFDNVDYHSKPK